jgi:hypothetical protein
MSRHSVAKLISAQENWAEIPSTVALLGELGSSSNKLAELKTSASGDFLESTKVLSYNTTSVSAGTAEGYVVITLADSTTYKVPKFAV